MPALLCAEFFHVEEPRDEAPAVLARAVVNEFINETLAVLGAVREEIFQLDQARQMNVQLRVAPTHNLAHPTAREAAIAALHLRRRATRRDFALDEGQQAPRLRRHVVETAAEHFMREPVRRRDVVEGCHDARRGFAAAAIKFADFALVLVQHGDRRDEDEVFGVE